MRRFISFFAISIGLFMSHTTTAQSDTLRQQLGQKMMLDLRFYCQSGDSKTCRQAVTTLPNDIKKLIEKHHIGGVILFSENTQTIEQTYQLSQSLRGIQSANRTLPPLFIAIDQEGGRVARLNRAQATSFTGNMSIGATYPLHQTKYATEVAKIIGQELHALGINVNFAPTVDVNSNPNNPVINVRSFSEDPKVVTTLGSAQVKAMENEGVISALKHFPGHGDTHVDSHTGLPRVNHDKQTIFNNDIYPFAQIIKTSPPGMIMTAHIQYPQLDSSTVKSKQGKTMIRPATMSKVIMHDVLREQLGYQGVTITDALDMAGISDFFDETKAVIETFKAGVDIALMPMAIRTPRDLVRFDKLMDNLVAAVNRNEVNKTWVAQSAKRIATLKSTLKPASMSLSQAQSFIGNPAHRKLEMQLAVDAITKVKNDGTVPLAKSVKRVHIIMPDTRKALALKHALLKHNPTLQIDFSSLQALDIKQSQQAIKTADILIAAHASPPQSAVEIGGMEDVHLLKDSKLSQSEQPKVLAELMRFAKSHVKKPVVFISLRAPYEIKTFGPLSNAVLASYAYNIDVDNDQSVSGPAFSALAEVLLGRAQALGQLPVSI
ncbi:Beta-hexosaminidase [Pseudoalteromonas luteoviolacea B = ATCC 29581]|nr:Beta-hexosaminidase [Pseudoalteromonas luteoviolacea B = ATCC 29581]